jgi:hypothetical protein
MAVCCFCGSSVRLPGILRSIVSAEVRLDEVESALPEVESQYRAGRSSHFFSPFDAIIFFD